MAYIIVTQSRLFPLLCALLAYSLYSLVLFLHDNYNIHRIAQKVLPQYYMFCTKPTPLHIDPYGNKYAWNKPPYRSISLNPPWLECL